MHENIDKSTTARSKVWQDWALASEHNVDIESYHVILEHDILAKLPNTTCTINQSHLLPLLI